MNTVKVLLALLFLFPYSVCSETIVAVSTSRNDVAEAIANATYGDTVIIPAGSSTWTSGIPFTRDIIIQGTGVGSTKLTVGFSDNDQDEAFFEFTPDAIARGRLETLNSAGTFEVTGIEFIGDDQMRYKFGVWIFNSSTTTAIRRIKIHDNKYTDIHRATEVRGDTWGVFYNNTVVDSNGAYPYANDYYSWNNHPMVPGSGDGWYIEDNTFSWDGGDYDVCGGGHGMGQIIRYNTVIGSSIAMYVEAHGNQQAYIRGTQITEIYGNNFVATANQGIDMRGGKCMIFFNIFNDDSLNVREEWADSYSGDALDGACPENGPQICTDSCVCMKVNHSYMWNNRDYSTESIQAFDVMDYGGIPYDLYDDQHHNDPRELLENREFFTQHATGTFNGSGDSDKGGGVGCGTLAQMNAITPTLAQVGFWVTDQSCSNLSDYIGANPNTPISGTLYRWSGSAWVAYYTPYQYPHPLRLSETAPPVPPPVPASPTKLRISD